MGLLFYTGTTLAAAMYIVGAVEIVLVNTHHIKLIPADRTQFGFDLNIDNYLFIKYEYMQTRSNNKINVLNIESGRTIYVSIVNTFFFSPCLILFLY